MIATITNMDITTSIQDHVTAPIRTLNPVDDNRRDGQCPEDGGGHVPAMRPRYGQNADHVETDADHHHHLTNGKQDLPRY